MNGFEQMWTFLVWQDENIMQIVFFFFLDGILLFSAIYTEKNWIAFCECLAFKQKS